jgi:hypothetical protein
MSKVNPLTWVALVLLIALLVTLILCQPSGAQVPGYPSLDATPKATSEIDPIPSLTPELVYSFTAFIPWVTMPVDLSVAQAQTFVPVGWIADFVGFNGLKGKAVVTGLQSLIILDVWFYGNTGAEIWLVKWPDLETPVYKLYVLEQRPYYGESIPMTNPPGALYLPWYLNRGSADTLVIVGTGPYYGILASGVFMGTAEIEK